MKALIEFSGVVDIKNVGPQITLDEVATEVEAAINMRMSSISLAGGAISMRNAICTSIAPIVKR